MGRSQVCFAVSERHRPACVCTEVLSDHKLSKVGSALCHKYHTYNALFCQCSDICAVSLLQMDVDESHINSLCRFGCITEHGSERGKIMSHFSSTRVMLQKAKNQNRILTKISFSF